MTSDRAWFSPGCELQDLLAPITPETFLRDYWAKRPLHVAGPPDKFARLLSPAGFLELAAKPGPAVDAGFRLRSGLGENIPEVRPAQIRGLLELGATICMTGLERASDELALFVAAIKAGLRYAGGVDLRAYWSGDGVGFPLHFDARIATTLQVAGSKRWRFSTQPALAWPKSNLLRDAEGRWCFRQGGVDVAPRPWETFQPPEQLEFEEVLLQPGDLLCLPAGTFHEASADGESLAINLAFNPSPTWELMAEILEAHFAADPAWRGGVPPALAQTTSAELAPEMREYLRARLREAAEFLEGSSLQSAALVDSIERRIHAPVGPSPRGVDHAGEPLQIQPDDEFEWSAAGPIGCATAQAPDGSQTLTLYQGRVGRWMQLPAKLAPLIQSLLGERRLRLAAIGSQSPAIVEKTLLLLLREGFITRAVPAGRERAPNTR